MRQAQNGDKVRVHYTGTLEDGTVFDSSRQRDPLEFTLGQGMLIPGFETGVLGMSRGDKKTVTIAPEDGYGEHHEAMVARIDRNDIPEDLKPEIGQQLQVSGLTEKPSTSFSPQWMKSASPLTAIIHWPEKPSNLN